LFLFLLFGAFLAASGAAKAFNDISYAIGGRMTGGPAQVAVIGSALVGSISGSSVANVVTTGTFTIPLMKKMGYPPHFAAAVEASASTGGMIMPPVMGAVAFIMCGFLGVSYTTVAAASILPSVLYFIGIGFMVHLEAKKRNLRGIPKEELPKLSSVLKKQMFCIVPIITIIIVLVIGMTPVFAGFVGIISCILISWLNPENRMGPKKILEALEDGAKSAISVGMACVCCGFIVCVSTITGIGSVIALNIMNLSMGDPLIALLLIGITALIMSMGLPGTALYVVVAVVCVPALVEMGILPLAAHFFVYWLGAMCNLTPPVAMAAIAAAGIADCSVFKTAFTGLKLACTGFLIPFVACFNPVILMQGATLSSYLWVAFTLAMGMTGLGIALQGYFLAKVPIWLRVLFGVGALLCIQPSTSTDIIGFGVLLLGTTVHWLQARRLQEIKPV
jgi:TRAP transporter 4TM/12TM fusion protein